MVCMRRAPSRVERQSQCLSFTVLPALPKLEVITACWHAPGALSLVRAQALMWGCSFLSTLTEALGLAPMAMLCLLKAQYCMRDSACPCHQIQAEQALSSLVLATDASSA